MSGWVPMPADGWEETAELLTSTGRPWPEQAAIADLRWWCDQRGKPPGRPALRRRWNWTDWSVKQLLRDEPRWQDRRTAPPAHRQHTASAPPARRQHVSPPTPAIRETPPADRQPTASEPPADRHTRKEIHTLHPHPTPSPSECPSDTRADERWPEVAEAYQAMRQASGVKASPPQPRKGMGSVLSRLVKREGVDDVLAVLRWVTTSDHHRAAYLREQQYGADTIARPGNFAAYLELARGAGAAPRARGSPASVISGSHPSNRQADLDDYERRHRTSP